MGKKKGGGVRIKQVGPKLPASGLLGNPMDALLNDPAVAQQIHLPPPPDRNYQIFWPLGEMFRMKTDNFQIIYPSYMDSTKTIAQGRRLGRDRCIETPTISDVSAVLQQLQIRHVLQPYKGYSPDPTCQWDNPGRCLVDVSQYKKKEILISLVERIPDLPSRQRRLEEQAAAKAVADAEATERAKTAITKTKVNTTGSNKKKGKKGSTKKKQ